MGLYRGKSAITSVGSGGGPPLSTRNRVVDIDVTRICPVQSSTLGCVQLTRKLVGRPQVVVVTERNPVASCRGYSLITCGAYAC